MDHLTLRPWQKNAIAKAENWLVNIAEDNRFLINAAPGAGKTICACAIAKRLIDLGLIERIIVIAPRKEVVRQWVDDVKMVTGRRMFKITSSDGDEDFGIDICATWAAVKNLKDGFQAICRSYKTLVICDEHHHAAVEATWGLGAGSGFKDAAYSLLLTGTPIRSDGAETVWLAFDDAGKIDHPEEGTYTLTYGEAVELGYCRPVTFHRHEGNFTVSFGDGSALDVNSKSPAKLTGNLKKIPHLQTALDFYRLACVPKYESDGQTPTLDSYHATMAEWGISKLDDVRNRMSNAGGLVIAPSIPMAEYFAKIIETMEGEKPTIVHNEVKNPEAKIGGFRNSKKRWIVSVAMISEGVDIKRLRVFNLLAKSYD